MTEEERNKVKIQMRWTPETKALADDLQKKLGVNRTAVTEMAIHRLAEAEGVKQSPPPPPPRKRGTDGDRDQGRGGTE